MSLVLAAAMALSVTSLPAQPEALLNWSTAAEVPTGPGIVVNRLHLDARRLLWNGKEVPEAKVGEYLKIVGEMEPQPLLVLSHSEQSSADDVQRARLMIDQALRCTPELCLELTAAPR